MNQELKLTQAEYDFASRFHNQYRSALRQGIPNVLRLIDSLFSKYQDAVERMQPMDPADFEGYSKWRFEEYRHIRSILHTTAEKKMREDYVLGNDKKHVAPVLTSQVRGTGSVTAEKKMREEYTVGNDKKHTAPGLTSRGNGSSVWPPHAAKPSINISSKAAEPVRQPPSIVHSSTSTVAQLIHKAGQTNRKSIPSRTVPSRTPPSRPPTLFSFSPVIETADDQSTPSHLPLPNADVSEVSQAVHDGQGSIHEDRPPSGLTRPRRKAAMHPLQPRPPPSLLYSTPPQRLPRVEDLETDDLDEILREGEEHFKDMDAWRNESRFPFPPERGPLPIPVPPNGSSPSVSEKMSPTVSEKPAHAVRTERVSQLKAATAPRRSPRIQNLSPTPLPLPTTKRRAHRQIFKLSRYTLTTDEEDNLELPPAEMLVALASDATSTQSESTTGQTAPQKASLSTSRRRSAKEFDEEAFSQRSVKRQRL